jgi:hypothetical protein
MLARLNSSFKVQRPESRRTRQNDHVDIRSQNFLVSINPDKSLGINVVLVLVLKLLERIVSSELKGVGNGRELHAIRLAVGIERLTGSPRATTSTSDQTQTNRVAALCPSRPGDRKCGCKCRSRHARFEKPSTRSFDVWKGFAGRLVAVLGHRWKYSTRIK